MVDVQIGKTTSDFGQIQGLSGRMKTFPGFLSQEDDISKQSATVGFLLSILLQPNWFLAASFEDRLLQMASTFLNDRQANRQHPKRTLRDVLSINAPLWDVPTETF